MPAEEWTVKWKRNRNHRGEEILPEKEAFELADEKRKLGFKVEIKKVSRASSPEEEETGKRKRHENYFFNGRKANAPLRR